MATRQYIGARYVPKFSDPLAWDKAKSYEALTIVTYLNNSYTSKKPVPANTDITNEDYWVVTGNYNAQVEQYRQDVEAVKEIVNNKSDKFVTPEMYGALGGTNDDTTAVQSALDSGYSVKFLQDYRVTNVTYSKDGLTIDFNGYSLIGISDTDDYVMNIISAMYNVFNNIVINGNFKQYYGCLNISSTASKQSQYNLFFGMKVSNAWHGLVWGAKESETSISQAQSETYIFGFRNRSTPISFLGNQLNGYLNFIGSNFDCNQYETWEDSRYSTDNNRCIKNTNGDVIFNSCEFVSSTNVKHINIEGHGIYAYDSIVEATKQLLLLNGVGDIVLDSFHDGYVGNAGTPFQIDSGAKGTLYLKNGTIHYGAVISNEMVYANSGATVQVVIENVTFKNVEAVSGTFGTVNVIARGIHFPYNNVYFEENDLLGLCKISSNTTSLSNYLTEENATSNVVDIPTLNERGFSVISSTAWGGVFSPYIPTIPGKDYLITFRGYATASNASTFVYWYDKDGTQIGDAITFSTFNTSGQGYSRMLTAPSNAMYARFRICTTSSTANTIYVTGLTFSGTPRLTTMLS